MERAYWPLTSCSLRADELGGMGLGPVRAHVLGRGVFAASGIMGTSALALPPSTGKETAGLNSRIVDAGHP